MGTSQVPASLSSTLQTAVRKLDSDLPIDDLRSMEVRIADSLITRRSPALLAGIFALAALLLAAIGTYGVLSYAVAQRRREIGVRMALGAMPKQIANQFRALGLRLFGAGAMLRIAGAWLARRAMQSILFDVPAVNMAMLAATSGIMAVVSLVACWLPARRAARVDPMVALKHE
jgi:ABC-type antimicrobial peptide transport system permease subunit